jgi:cbb3-type cytochrome oxidase subunit 3
MVRFIGTWVTVIVVMFVLSLSWSIFSPLLNQTFSDLVDHAIFDNQELSAANGHHVSYYYASLYASKNMLLAFFNLFPFILSTIALIWAVLSAMRKEESDYPV